MLLLLILAKIGYIDGANESTKIMKLRLKAVSFGGVSVERLHPYESLKTNL